MCIRIRHLYGCGHTISDKAPCAASRRRNCGVSNLRTAKHEEKCDTCDPGEDVDNYRNPPVFPSAFKNSIPVIVPEVRYRIDIPPPPPGSVAQQSQINDAHVLVEPTVISPSLHLRGDLYYEQEKKVPARLNPSVSRSQGGEHKRKRNPDDYSLKRVEAWAIHESGKSRCVPDNSIVTDNSLGGISNPPSDEAQAMDRSSPAMAEEDFENDIADHDMSSAVTEDNAYYFDTARGDIDNDHQLGRATDVVQDSGGDHIEESDNKLAEEHTRNEVSTRDDSDDPRSYYAAFTYFGFFESTLQSQSPEPQDTSEGAGSSSSGKGSVSSRSGSSGFTAFNGSSAASANPGFTESGHADFEGSTVIATSQSRVALVQKPLDLLCWHAIVGIKCKGKTGSSPSARRLYNDHSLSSKTANNHKLPLPCGRCELLFPDEVSAKDHEAILKSDTSCPILDADEVTRRNSVVERIGISVRTQAAIKKALSDFRGGNRKQSQTHTLPYGCDRNHFRKWVSRNVPTYIGESNTREDVAMKELSHWYIKFCVMFPDKKIPTNPFAESIEVRYRRLLELLKTYWGNAAASGNMPPLTSEQDATLDTMFYQAVDTLNSEVSGAPVIASEPLSAPIAATLSSGLAPAPVTDEASIQNDALRAAPNGACDVGTTRPPPSKRRRTDDSVSSMLHHLQAADAATQGLTTTFHSTWIIEEPTSVLDLEPTPSAYSLAMPSCMSPITQSSYQPFLDLTGAMSQPSQPALLPEPLPFLDFSDMYADTEDDALVEYVRKGTH